MESKKLVGMLSCATFNKLLYPTAAEVAAVNVASTTTKTVMTGLAPSSGAPSETHSEISSADSDWSDIRTIALKLGVQNVDDLHTERFKVDRQKLEQMIKTESAVVGMNGAEYFFDNIMKTTETYVSWPCRLKIGAKSKKDPHVRIVGKLDEVTVAKEKILSSLDSRGTRVIMKMDVSYTDHSYIIGRGGNNIKRIMEETQTHIHFPDSNRSNPTEKSNQVSLCGSLEGVERARSLVRLSTPLLISFELPIMGPGQLQPDHETPYIKMVEAKYNVQVIFSSRPKLHSALVLVKGSEKEAAQVQEATQILINYTCENVANQILVNVQMEISPQHHEIVKGKNNHNLLNIMERTKTKIIFPDLSDMNVKPLKKSQVTITGRIEDVYKARQQLLGNLPVALIFDFPDNQSDASEIMGLNTKYGVYITLRQKQRQSTLAIVIKGVEKFIDKIYEARQEILNLNTPPVRPHIPDTYMMPQDKEINLAYRTQLTSLLAGYPDSPKTPGMLPNSPAHMSPYGKNNNNLLLNNNNNPYMTNGMTGMGNYMTSPNGATGICAPTQKYMQMHNNYQRQQQQQQQQQLQVNHNNNYLQVPPMMLQQQQLQQKQNGQQGNSMMQQPPPHASSVSPRNTCSQNTSGYQSFSSSTTSLEQAYPPYVAGGGGGGGGGGGASSVNSSLNNSNGLNAANAVSSTSRGNYSPDSTYSSEAGVCTRTGRRSSDGVLLGLGASGPIGPMLPGSAESYRSLHYDFQKSNNTNTNNNNRTFDFDLKRAMGFKAMERTPIPGELRTPNTNWMGMGLSRTSPAPMEAVGAAAAAAAAATTPVMNTINNNNSNEDAWTRSMMAGAAAAAAAAGLAMPPPPVGLAGGLSSPYGLCATTGLIDVTPTNRRLQLSQQKDIHSLLTSLGLEHYIKIFVLNEIDLEMFTTLTEENLMELGITAFGARKKILVAIHTLLANDAATSSMPSSSSVASSPRFSGSAAPGAERRPSNQW